MICTAVKNLESFPLSDLVELRLDYLKMLELDKIAAYQKKLAKPLIFTLRKATQGGNFKGTEKDRLDWIYKLAALKPEYFDIEEEVGSEVIESLQTKFPSIRWIISYHDFNHTPDNLENIIDRLMQHKAHFYKIALMANNSLDTLKLLVALKNASRNDLIMLSMGEDGVFGRILAPYFGSPFTFASFSDEEATAPGQMTFNQLTRYYAFKNPDFYALIGDPVSKSISDKTHNAVFKLKNLNAIYVKIRLKETELKEAFEAFKHLNFKGISITMPLKEASLVFLDQIDPDAAKMQSINTLVISNERFRGLSTDGLGAVYALNKKGSVADKNVFILGGGGAAKSIIYSLKEAGANLSVFMRNPIKGLNLEERFKVKVYPFSELSKKMKEGYEILINTTPDECPLDPHELQQGKIVMDIKTLPRETKLLKEALQRDCKVVYGYEMFIGQALLQFKEWFPGQTDLETTLEAEALKCL